MKNNLAIGIQARSGSVRFPNKALAPICGKPCLHYVIEAALQADIAPVVLLIPFDDPLKSLGEQFRGLLVMPGPPGDLLTHYWQLSRALPSQWFMRLTGDCPMLTPGLIREAWQTFGYKPYWNNRDFYPDGFDIEIFSENFLKMANVAVTDPADRNHCVYMAAKKAFPDHFLSLDYEADLEPIQKARAEID